MTIQLVTDTAVALAAELAKPQPRTVPEIGLHAGVDALVYHSWQGCSQSRLKVLRDHSPAHLRYQMDHPEEPTDAMRLGAAIHTCVLEPDLFPTLYVRGIEGDGRTKSVKEAREALAAEFPRHHILKPSDYDTCLAIRDSVGRHPRTRHLLQGERERSAVWRDPETDVLCRGRFDDIARSVGAIADLKSCEDASPFRFPSSIFSYGYHLQAAMYLRGARALGIDADTFVFIAVEKKPPFAVVVYQLNSAAISDGERELDPLMALWAKCEASGEWPCYSTDVLTVDLPVWAPKQIDARLEGATR